MCEKVRANTNAYAVETADCYECAADLGESIELSYTDLKLSAKWARYYATRWRRRVVYAVALAIVAALGSGVPGLGRDGPASKPAQAGRSAAHLAAMIRSA